jgi:hypothetical protein
MNNQSFSVGQEDIDKEAMADSVCEFACEMFETDAPNKWQLERAYDELISMNEGKYL